MPRLFPLSKGKPRKPPAAKRRRDEDLLQGTICSYIAWTVPGATAFAIPNKSIRTTSGRAGNFVPGLRKGAFDLAIILPPREGELNGRVAFVELKIAGNDLDPDQEEFQDVLIKARIPHRVCWSVDDLREALAIWGVKTRDLAPLPEVA